MREEAINKEQYKQKTDQELVIAVLQGDDGAYHRLIDRYGNSLYHLAVNNLSQQEDAYDVIQDTFISAWESLERYDPSRPLNIWLQRITLNKCRDRARKAWVRRIVSRFGDVGVPAVESIVDARDDNETLLKQAAVQQRIEAAVVSLPENLRHALLLVMWEGLSYKDAAKVLGTSSKVIENRLYRAKKKLAVKLDPSDILDIVGSP